MSDNNSVDLTAPTSPPEPRMDTGGAVAELGRSKASRRSFIKGVVASGAVVSSAGYVFGGLSGCTPEQAAAPGGVERLLRLNVNGEMRSVDVLPNETLAMTLRYKLGLTGTKLGCDRGECGACTVLIDGIPTRSCITSVGEVGDGEVQTIEGLAAGATLHKVQLSFLQHEAMQCGYCVPGHIMTAVALSRAKPNASRAEIVDALSEHICRCCNYSNIRAAVEGAVRSNREGGK